MKKSAEQDVRKYAFIFLAALIIIAIFTLIDFAVHLLSEEYAVPDYYFRNKLIFGTIIGFIALVFMQKLKTAKKALAFSAIVSVLLQLRYFLEGYPLQFVLEFLVFHFVILVPVSLLTLKTLEKS